MVYMGSKNRIAKELLPFIQAELTEGIYYVEPFAGGCNMIDKVEHSKRIAADCNQYLIALLQYQGELPEYISREEYLSVKQNPENYPDWYVGFCGFICSFRGMFFKSYVKNDVLKKSGKIEHYQKEQINNFRKQRAKLTGIQFECCSYESLHIPEGAVIYCDPPYKGTAEYDNRFDSAKFWQWVRTKVESGHKVYISEYSAPDDFECIWQKGINSNLGGASKTAVEKLFIHKSQMK